MWLQADYAVLGLVSNCVSLLWLLADCAGGTVPGLVSNCVSLLWLLADCAGPRASQECVSVAVAPGDCAAVSVAG